MSHKKYSPSQIANHFILFARSEKKDLNILKLIKLVYIAYGWCLCTLNRRVFDEPIEAWKHGPVISSLYHEFKHFGNKNIDKCSEDFEYSENEELLPKPFIIKESEDLSVSKVIEAVWDRYKEKTGWDLRELTHKKGSPWSKAWGNKENDKILKDEDIAIFSQKAISKMIEDEGWKTN
jgi:uncharacterized phage-associated protein